MQQLPYLIMISNRCNATVHNMSKCSRQLLWDNCPNILNIPILKMVGCLEEVPTIISVHQLHQIKTQNPVSGTYIN